MLGDLSFPRRKSQIRAICQMLFRELSQGLPMQLLTEYRDQDRDLSLGIQGRQSISRSPQFNFAARLTFEAFAKTLSRREFLL
jgi:hypothetical protein